MNEWLIRKERRFTLIRLKECVVIEVDRYRDVLKRFIVASRQTGYEQREGRLEVFAFDGCDRAGARDYEAFLGFFSLDPS